VTRGCWTASVNTNDLRARRRCPHPRSTHASLWYDRRESSCQRAAPANARKHRPLPAVPRPAAFRVSDPARDARRVMKLQNQGRGHSTPLVIAPGARRMWRHSTNSNLTMRDQGPWIRMLPRRMHPHRRARSALRRVDRARSKRGWQGIGLLRDRGPGALSSSVPACLGCLFNS
jgi:hypothetical protein